MMIKKFTLVILLASSFTAHAMENFSIEENRRNHIPPLNCWERWITPSNRIIGARGSSCWNFPLKWIGVGGMILGALVGTGTYLFFGGKGGALLPAAPNTREPFNLPTAAMQEWGKASSRGEDLDVTPPFMTTYGGYSTEDFAPETSQGRRFSTQAPQDLIHDLDRFVHAHGFSSQEFEKVLEAYFQANPQAKQQFQKEGGGELLPQERVTIWLVNKIREKSRGKAETSCRIFATSLGNEAVIREAEENRSCVVVLGMDVFGVPQHYSRDFLKEVCYVLIQKGKLPSGTSVDQVYAQGVIAEALKMLQEEAIASSVPSPYPAKRNKRDIPPSLYSTAQQAAARASVKYRKENSSANDTWKNASKNVWEEFKKPFRLLNRLGVE